MWAVRTIHLSPYTHNTRISQRLRLACGLLSAQTRLISTSLFVHIPRLLAVYKIDDTK